MKDEFVNAIKSSQKTLPNMKAHGMKISTLDLATEVGNITNNVKRRVLGVTENHKPVVELISLI